MKKKGTMKELSPFLKGGGAKRELLVIKSRRSSQSSMSQMSDRPLSMSHNMMECCIMISGNDSNWSKREREQVIERAVDLYMGKGRTSVFAKAGSSVEEGE